LDLYQRRWLPEAVRAVQAAVGERVTPTWITVRDFRRVLKKANSERKRRSVKGRKSQARTCWARVCKNALHVCPRSLGVRTALMYF